MRSGCSALQNYGSRTHEAGNAIPQVEDSQSSQASDAVNSGYIINQVDMTTS